MGIYVVIKTGGKQYRVSPGDVVRVERLSAGPGSAVEIRDVFLFVNGSEVAVGNPTVAGVRILAEVIEEGRGEKIRIFKKRRRKHYQKTQGHRQRYSALRINEIIHGDKRFQADNAGVVAAGVPGKRNAAAAPAATPLARPAEAPRPPAPSGKTADVAPTPPTVATPAAPTPVVPAAASPPPVSDVRPRSEPPEPIASERARAPVETQTPPPARPTRDGERAGQDRIAPAPDASSVPAGVARVPGASRDPLPSAPLPSPGVASAAPDAEPRRYIRYYWPLAALLSLLLASAGWLLKGGKEPPAAGAHVEATPAEQSPPRRTIKEVRVRKPARASAPADPAQPPD